MIEIHLSTLIVLCFISALIGSLAMALIAMTHDRDERHRGR